MPPELLQMCLLLLTPPFPLLLAAQDGGRKQRLYTGSKPNLEPITVTAPTPGIFFRSAADIAPGDELLIDYEGEYVLEH